MAASMILRCSICFPCFIASNASINERATIELITALALAKICTSNPRSTFSCTLPSNTTAIKTIAENPRISQFAFLSFFFQTAINMIYCFFRMTNSKRPTPKMARRKTTAINCSLPAKKLFLAGSFSMVSNTRSEESREREAESSPS